MKKVCCSMPDAVACIMGIFLGLASLGMVTYAVIDGAKQIGACIFLIVCSLIGIVAIIFALNEGSCWIWIDRDTGELCRRGFLFGYKYRLKLDEITYIIKIPAGRHAWVVLVTDCESRLKKDVLKKAIPFGMFKKSREFFKEVIDVDFDEVEIVCNRDFKHGNYDGTFIR